MAKIKFVTVFAAGLLDCALFAAAASPVDAAGVRGQVQAGFNGIYLGTNALGPVHATINDVAAINLVEGVSTGQADKMFADNRTEAASSNESLDLYGSLTDPTGGTLNFVTIKAIYIKASCNNTNDVLLGGAASNAFYGPFNASTDIVAIRPCGVLMIFAPNTGWAVNSSTAHLLKLANSSSGSGVNFDIIILGTSS